MFRESKLRAAKGHTRKKKQKTDIVSADNISIIRIAMHEFIRKYLTYLISSTKWAAVVEFSPA